jgi:hypothetical protein
LKKYYPTVKKAIFKVLELIKISAKKVVATKDKAFVKKLIAKTKKISLEKLPKVSIKTPKRKYIYRIIAVVVAIIIIVIVIRTLSGKKNNNEQEKPREQVVLMLDVSKYTLSSNVLGVFPKSDSLVIFDSGSLYTFDLLKKKGEFILPALGSGYVLTNQIETDKALIYFSPQGKVLVANKDTLSFEIKKIEGVAGETVLDVASFGNNVYILTASGKVIKYAESDFLKPSVWIDRSADFGSTYLSLTVDGSVYILETSGLIRKYNAGKMDKTFLITVTGMANKGDKIFTKAEFKNIYLMSKTQNKIFVFDKESRTLKKTIENTNWRNLKNLYISADESTAYLVDGLNIYQISL